MTKAPKKSLERPKGSLLGLLKSAWRYFKFSHPSPLHYYNGNYEWRLVHLFGPLFYVERIVYDDEPNSEIKDENVLLKTSIYGDL